MKQGRKTKPIHSMGSECRVREKKGKFTVMVRKGRSQRAERQRKRKAIA